MNFDEIVVKESPGLCRCCLSEGCYKDLGSEYTWMNENEVYADMLLECFDISISQHTDGPNGSNRLICEVCITRLRDACNFKKQVLDSEKKFVDLLARGEFQPKMVMYQAEPMKTEQLLEESAADDADVEYLEDMDLEDDVPLNQIGHSLEASVSEVGSSIKVKGKRGRPRKTTTSAKPEKKPKIPKLEEKPRSSKAVAKDEHLTDADINFRRRRKNLRKIFENSSVYPFEWRGEFTCFYCDKPCPLDELRKHTESHSFSQISPKNRLLDIKVDVSVINCKLCRKHFQNINEIIEHLNLKHRLKYDKRAIINWDQFRLSNLSCMCLKKFNSFVELQKHYNDNHPKILFSCRKCLQNFTSKECLEAHLQDIHNIFKDKGDFKYLVCSSCQKVFTTKKGYKEHIKKICVKVKTKILTDIEPEKRANLQNLRESIACFLNTCNVMPFKFFMQKFRCFYCSKDFVDCEILRHHTSIEHTHCDPKSRLMKLIKGSSITVKIDITDLFCKICGVSADSVEEIIEHTVIIHRAEYSESLTNVLQPYKLAKDNMPCLICPDVNFRYFSKLLEHMNELHSKNKIICSFCGMTFGKDPNYRSHLKRHHNPNSLKCNDCHLEFDNYSKLSNHRAKLHGEKSHKCPECFETFGTQYKRQKHLIDAHGSGHPCTYCGKLFTRNSFMKDHIRRSHLKEKNVECSVCKEKFFDNILLRIHMVKHIGERNFHCDVCGKRFLWKKNLRGHMASHK